jgi:uncharacterized Tic20 family protein
MTTDTYSADALPDAVRNTITLLHLSALVGLCTGIGFLLGPLVVWLLKKDEHPAIDAAGKDAVNFQITMLVTGLVAALLCITVIGLIVGVPLAIAVGLAALVFPIVAAVKSTNGEAYRYPFTHRFIR